MKLTYKTSIGIWFLVILFSLSLQKSVMAEEAAITVKIMTLNLHNGEDAENEGNFSRFVQLVAAEQPDIIALQEVQPRHLKYLRIPGYVSVSGPNANLPFFRFGNALLTRHPIVYHRHHYLPSQKEQRGMDEAAIEIDGQTLRILNTHIGLGLAEQKRQIDEISRISGYLSGPLLITGDFNLEPSQKIMKVFNLQEVGSGMASYKTYPANQPRFQLDQIWYNEYFQLLEARPIDWRGSDHLPVVARLILRNHDAFPVEKVDIPDPTLKRNPLLPDVGDRSAKMVFSLGSNDYPQSLSGLIVIPISDRFQIRAGHNGEYPELNFTYVMPIDLRDYFSLSGVRAKAEWGFSAATDCDGSIWMEWIQYYRWSDHWGNRLVFSTNVDGPDWSWEQDYLPVERLRLSAGINTDSEWFVGVAATPDKQQVFKAQYGKGRNGVEYRLGWELRF